MPMVAQLQVQSPNKHPLHHSYSHITSISSFTNHHHRDHDDHDPSQYGDAFEGDGLHDQSHHHDIHSPSEPIEQWQNEQHEWSIYDSKHEKENDFGQEGEGEDSDPRVFPLSSSSTKRITKKRVEFHTCPEEHCGKSFPRSFALRRHMRIHTGMKPYPCDFEGCTQRFNTSGNLSRHKRIHSGERPYPCVFTTCGKRFNTSTKLKRHMRIHFPEGQNLFQCLDSGCTFACDNYKEFVHHQRAHGNITYMDMPQDEQNNLHSGLKRDVDSGFMGLSSADVPERRLFGLSTPSGISLLLKEAQRDTDREADYGHHDPLLRYPLMKTPTNQSHHDDRPRLPFLTEAFPSDSIVSASPMNGAGFGSSFLNQYGGHHSGHHPLRPSFLYESSNPTGPSFPFMHRSHVTEPFSHYSYGHHVSFSPASQRNQSDEGKDSPSRVDHHEHGNSQHNPEFTGEELNAVLELMNE